MAAKSLFSLLLAGFLILSSLSANAESEPPKQTAENQAVSIQEPTFQKIKTLRNEGKSQEAKAIAVKHLETNPNDADVRLMLGYIYYQEKNYSSADAQFSKVLATHPNYTDAKIGLIRTKKAEKQTAEANRLLKEASAEDPNNNELKQLSTPKTPHKKVTARKQRRVKKVIVNPYAYIDEEIAQGNYREAMLLTDEALAEHPHDPDLLAKKSKLFFMYHLYAQAAYTSRQALMINPNQPEAKEVYALVEEVSPNRTYGLNQIGIYTLNDYVSDLGSVWDYSSLYYSRETSVGPLIARLNYASRLGVNGPQGEIEFLPVFHPNFYMDFDVTYANHPEIFPQYSVLAEGYVTIPRLLGLTFSLGEYYGYIIRGSALNRYTASLSRSFDQWWFAIRSNYYVPNNGGKPSALAIGTIRRYFGNIDTYISLNVGGGTSPDLSDLETLNFIVIDNIFANLNVRIPLFTYQTLLDLGLDYANWKYPSGHVRNLYGASIGISYRF